MQIHFEALAEGHLPALAGWLQPPHVRAFWHDGERDLAAVRAHYFRPGRDVPGFVFWFSGRAAGFVQRERVLPGHDFMPWAALNGETWAVDVLIGEPELVGRGLGPLVIGAFLAQLRLERPALRRVVIDPAVGNGRAYAKAGFTPVGLFTSTDGIFQMMYWEPIQS